MRENLEINPDAINEKIELSPIDKYLKFNRFPWKLVIHMALLVFTTIQTLNMVDLVATYQKPMLQAFKYVLMNSTDQDFSQTFFTLSDFQTHLQGLTTTLSDLGSYMLNRVDSSDATYNFEVYYTDPLDANFTSQSDATEFFAAQNAFNNYTYPVPDITAGIFQPFNYSNITDIKAFIQKIESMNFNIENLYTSSQLVSSQFICYNWSITLQYQFVSMSHIVTTLQAFPTYCQLPNNSDASSPESIRSFYPKNQSDNVNFAKVQTYTPFGNNLNILHIVVFCLAVASLVFGWFYVYEMGLLYMSTRHAKHMNEVNINNEPHDPKDPYHESWEDLSFTEKFRFFDVFLIVTMLGNIFQILGSIIAIYQNFTPDTSSAILSIKEACVGLGCMCCWFNIIKYLSYNKDFKATTNILSRSTTDFLKFLVGIIPLYMAFVFLGRCIFWKYEKFETTQHAIVALFAIMAGDIIDETYTDTAAEGIFSLIFLTVWLLLFMSAVHNVFISIISEGFRSKFLEDRYQELFNMYALGGKNEVSKVNTDDQGQSKPNMPEEQTKEDVLSLMPYLRRDSDMNFDPLNREKMRKIEMEKQKLKETILEKTDEVEKILGNMKDAVNEFCSVNKDKEEKKIVKNCFLKCLKDLHLFMKAELSKDQSNNLNLSRSGLDVNDPSNEKPSEASEKSY